MGDMRPRPPYLQRERTRHGKMVWYFRRGGIGPRIRIHGEFGSPQFLAEYEAAQSDIKSIIGKPKAQSGSLQWLYDRYRETTAWAELSEATRRQRENILDNVMAKSGSEPYASIRPSTLEAGKDRRRDTPSQARNFLDAMRGLFKWAQKAGHVAVDPAKDIENPKRKKSDGFLAWDQEDVARYEARWPAGTRQHVWLYVLLYTGARRGDAVTLGKQHVRNGALIFITEKGRDRRRIEVVRPLEPELVAVLAQGPCGDLAFICGERGRPFTKESFGNEFKEACVAAGIMTKSAHGLRKLSATIWAERGATEHELMGLFGWLTPAMAAHYTKEANRRKLAMGAAKRLLGTTPEHYIPAPDGEVRGRS